MSGKSEGVKNFCVLARITKTKSYCRLQKDCNSKNSFTIIQLLRGSWLIILKFAKSAFMFSHDIIFPRESVVFDTAIHNLSVPCLRTATGLSKYLYLAI